MTAKTVKLYYKKEGLIVSLEYQKSKAPSSEIEIIVEKKIIPTHAASKVILKYFNP
jgi:hypothetical protein